MTRKQIAVARAKAMKQALPIVRKCARKGLSLHDTAMAVDAGGDEPNALPLSFVSDRWRQLIDQRLAKKEGNGHVLKRSPSRVPVWGTIAVGEMGHNWTVFRVRNPDKANRKTTILLHDRIHGYL